MAGHQDVVVLRRTRLEHYQKSMAHGLPGGVVVDITGDVLGKGQRWSNQRKRMSGW